MKNIIRLLFLLLTLSLPAFAVETNCGVAVFSTDSPDPVTFSTNWLTASYCNLIGGKEYSFSRGSSVPGLNGPGPGFTWVDEVDLDIVWWPEIPGSGFGGATSSYRVPGTGMVTVYMPAHETNQYFVLNGATVTGPSIVPTVKAKSTFTVSTMPTKGATALLAGSKRIPRIVVPKPPALPEISTPPPTEAAPVVQKPLRHLDWAKLLKYPMRKLPIK